MDNNDLKLQEWLSSLATDDREESSLESLRVIFVGDIALDGGYESILRESGAIFPFAKIRDHFLKADIVVGNLEAPLTIRGESMPFKCCMRANPGYIEGLKDAGFDILTLSNNHILDFHEEGALDTSNLLEDHGIRHLGVARNLIHAREPLVWEQNGVRIGFLNYCAVRIDSPFYVRNDRFGIVPLEIGEAEADVRALKETVHVVIVSIHWGLEQYHYPTPEQRRTAHRLIDAGADVVVGHHPHVVQGIERYGNGLICYSLGNFLFSDMEWQWPSKDGSFQPVRISLTPHNREGLALVLNISKYGIERCQCMPTRINESGQVCRDERNIRMEQLAKYSAPLDFHPISYKLWWCSEAVKQEAAVRIPKMFPFKKLITQFYRLRPYHFRRFCTELQEFFAAVSGRSHTHSD